MKHKYQDGWMGYMVGLVGCIDGIVYVPAPPPSAALGLLR